MKIERVFVTPEYAQSLLEKNTNNRDVRKRHVAYLSRELTLGRWQENGDAIRISKEGVILDGQHRLLAVIDSSVSIWSLIISELDKSVFTTIDVGSKRSFSDALSIQGYKNVKNLASALQVTDMIIKGEDFNAAKPKWSNSDIIEGVEKYPGIVNAVNKFSLLRTIGTPSVVAGAFYAFSTVNKEKAEEFFEKLTDGLNLNATDPIYHLRQRLISNSSAKAKMSRSYMTALFIKTWNYFITGKEIKILKFIEEGASPEKFPSIYDAVN